MSEPNKTEQNKLGFGPKCEKEENKQLCLPISRQFHQRYTREFFVRKSFLAAFSSYVLALAKNLYKNFARIMLMKLRPGVNFINIF